jgi:hypothetical protein
MAAKPHTKPAHDLSNAEKRELIPQVQARNPLPGKYRFLFFESNR